MKILRRASILIKAKYSKAKQSYNDILIDNIIYNEKSQGVAVFKDNLILDDISEFLKRCQLYIDSILVKR
jgi:hypothetical protein